ncbi:MAG: carboxypeptidase regulatory-like domain-containing protein [Acidobacteriaceae bacterium]|nr:carboxypeptidase regulatory-like domain-containing protein [Acidobacteriaceae bacterium]MBV9779390.1 carboxypeptidase regulatory-like domain-containing protein [Acidobacteriaceae bacterium]
MKPLLGITFTLLLAMTGWTQTSTGTITGTVIDASGGSIAGANVFATNAGTGAERRTATNNIGFYQFIELPPGMYSITVEAPGFAKTTIAAQRLVVASNLRVDVTLQIGKVNESVTVDETSPQVNTEDAQLGRSITDIASLPILSGNGGRNALSLIALQPGVTTTPGTAAQTPAAAVGDFEVNGQRSQANNFVLDGTDSNDLAIGAEEIFRNRVLNSNNFFLNEVGTPKPKYNLNDFDANLGGPVIKNRTFFFASYLGFRRVFGVSNSGTVFSDAERAAILAHGVPAAKAIVNITPVASSSDTLFSAPVDSLNRDQGLFKVDHRFSNANNFSVLYFTERATENAPFSFGGPTIPGFGELDFTTYHNVALHDTHSFSPILLTRQ